MSSRLPRIIHRKLDHLDWFLRFCAVLDGIAVWLFTFILLFLLDVACDRFFEFPLFVRTILLATLTAGLTYVFAECILFRYFTPIRRDQLATALEHFIPGLNESLVTVIDCNKEEDVDPELMKKTINQAVTALRGVDVRRFFRIRRVVSRFAFSLLGVLMVSAGCLYHSEMFALWFSRNVLLSQQDYPRRSQLLVDGFRDGRVRVGRGDSFTLSIRANTAMPKVPDTVRVRIGTPEAGYRMMQLDQFRMENREGIPWRIFATTFPEMLETVDLQIRGADSTLDDLCIEVVPTPTLTDMMLHQQFPEYMQRPERTVALTGRTMIPDGTAITITAKSTKPLLDASAIINQAEMPLSPTTQPFDSITLTLPALRAETTIEFRLQDIDSLTNRHPIRTELGIIRDQPPSVTARLEGIGPAITPEAILPMVGEITDDHGLAFAAARYTTEPAFNEEAETQREPTEGMIPITGMTMGQMLFPLAQSFAVSPLPLLPDDQLVLHIEAGDLFDLPSSPGQMGTPGQIGEGPRWQLEIVTPEKLKHLLETREITLRQRFEVVLGEVERTKNILQDFALEPMEQQIQEAEALTAEHLAGTPHDESEEQRAARQAELDARRQTLLDTILSEQADLGNYHIARMLRDTQKEVYDLTHIVESFRTIRAEMINNRIFTEDERRRIEQDIMSPIQELIGTDFPGIDELLNSLKNLLLERHVPNRPPVLAVRQQILSELDAILSKMTAIRDKMASMESFHEVLELLRSIIRQQQQLRNETIEERSRRLRSLTE